MRTKIKTIIVICIILFIASGFSIHFKALVLECYQTGEVVWLHTIRPDDEFTMRWIHSVELKPWEEIFKIDENYDIYLDRTRFKQFGAGVPDYAGNKTEVVDDYIIFSGIHQKMDIIPYGISAFAEHTFYFEDQEIPLYKQVKDGYRINIYTANYNLFQYVVAKL